MFFLGYLRSELVRRKGRTILTVLGLAVGVSLVIAVSALSRGLDRAQAKALDPLSSIGTDLTVTLAPEQSQGGGQRLRRRRLRGRPRGDPGEPVRDHGSLEARQARRRISFTTSSCRARSSPSRRARRSRSRRCREWPRSRAASFSPQSTRRGRCRRSSPRSRRAASRSGSTGSSKPPTAAEFAKMQACLDEGGRPVRRRCRWRRRSPDRTGRGRGRPRRRKGRRRSGRPERVPEVPAGPAAAVPRDGDDAGADAAAGREPTPDEHQELRLHDRGCRPGQARDRGRHAGPRLERPVPGSPLRLARGSRGELLREAGRASRSDRSSTSTARRSPSSASCARRSGARPPTSTCRSAQLQKLASQKGAVNVVLVRADQRRPRSARCSSRSRRSSRAPRSRARSRWPTRSAARSSTRPTSRSGSGRRSPCSWRPPPSCSPSC